MDDSMTTNFSCKTARHPARGNPVATSNQGNNLFSNSCTRTEGITYMEVGPNKRKLELIGRSTPNESLDGAISRYLGMPLPVT